MSVYRSVPPNQHTTFPSAPLHHLHSPKRDTLKELNIRKLVAVSTCQARRLEMFSNLELVIEVLSRCCTAARSNAGRGRLTMKLWVRKSPCREQRNRVTLQRAILIYSANSVSEGIMSLKRIIALQKHVLRGLWRVYLQRGKVIILVPSLLNFVYHSTQKNCRWMLSYIPMRVLILATYSHPLSRINTRLPCSSIWPWYLLSTFVFYIVFNKWRFKLDNSWHCFNPTDGRHIRIMKPHTIANIALMRLGHRFKSTIHVQTHLEEQESSFWEKHVYDHLLMNTDIHMHAIMLLC